MIEALTGVDEEWRQMACLLQFLLVNARIWIEDSSSHQSLIL